VLLYYFDWKFSSTPISSGGIAVKLITLKC